MTTNKSTDFKDKEIITTFKTSSQRSINAVQHTVGQNKTLGYKNKSLYCKVKLVNAKIYLKIAFKISDCCVAKLAYFNGFDGFSMI